MKSILEENLDHRVRKYAMDTLSDTAMIYLRDIYTHRVYPLPYWMTRSQEQALEHGVNDEEGISKDGPSPHKKKRDSLPPATQTGTDDDPYRSQGRHYSKVPYTASHETDSIRYSPHEVNT